MHLAIFLLFPPFFYSVRRNAFLNTITLCSAFSPQWGRPMSDVYLMPCFFQVSISRHN